MSLFRRLRNIESVTGKGAIAYILQAFKAPFVEFPNSFRSNREFIEDATLKTLYWYKLRNVYTLLLFLAMLVAILVVVVFPLSLVPAISGMLVGMFVCGIGHTESRSNILSQLENYLF